MSHQIDSVKSFVKGQLINEQTSPAEGLIEIGDTICVSIGDVYVGVSFKEVEMKVEPAVKARKAEAAKSAKPKKPPKAPPKTSGKEK